MQLRKCWQKVRKVCILRVGEKSEGLPYMIISEDSLGRVTQKTRIIVNRQKASENRKYGTRLPEAPTLSIHTANDVDYAFGVRLDGAWAIVQDYANSPCSGAHIWIESVDGEDSYLEITHRKPQSEHPITHDGEHTQEGSDGGTTPNPDPDDLEFF